MPLPPSSQAPHCLTSFQNIHKRLPPQAKTRGCLCSGPFNRDKAAAVPRAATSPCPAPAKSQPRGQSVGWAVTSQDTTRFQVRTGSPRIWELARPWVGPTGQESVPSMGQHPGVPVPSFRGTPLEAGRPVARPDCLPQELVTLNSALYHLSVSHSRLRALPGPLSLILFLPVFLSSLHSLSTNYF